MLMRIQLWIYRGLRLHLVLLSIAAAYWLGFAVAAIGDGDQVETSTEVAPVRRTLSVRDETYAAVEAYAAYLERKANDE